MPESLTSDPPSSNELDVIIFAPHGRDARVLCETLEKRDRLRCVPMTSLHDVCERINLGVGAILMTSEAVSDAWTHELNETLSRQPPWSDVPIIMLTRPHGRSNANSLEIDDWKQNANMMVVERPAQIVTIVLAVRTALRARRRQYAVRGYLGAIRNSETQLRFALRAGRMGTWDIDLRTHLVSWSEGMYAILGLEPHSAVPTIELWEGLIHADDREKALDQFRKARDGQSELIGEQRMLMADGTTKWVETRARFTYNSDGVAERAAGVAIDVDQRKRTEVELRSSQMAAESANIAKDRFLAVLSHELRTPLTPVLALVQMLQGDDSLPEEMHEPMEIIRRNMELEARLIDDLLDLTRIVRGKFELQHEHIDLHAALQSALGICTHDIGAKRLSISTSLEAQRHTIHGDSTRLQQVFWNLLKNAVKFTPAGGKITITTRDDVSGVIVTVSDSGVGITPQLLPHVFKAFEQGGREMTRAFGGLGLGLTISKAIVEAHGGTLLASSDGPGKGATFTSVFPPATIETSPTATPQSANADAAFEEHCRILLVEDHPDTANVLKHLLHDLGHDVQLSETIAAAKNALKQSAFDLILSDLGLPDGSGIDLIRAAHQTADTPAIALSGYGMSEDVERSLAAGFSAHLTKPVNIVQLKTAITQLMHGRREMQKSAT